jgi:hypothetical protein
MHGRLLNIQGGLPRMQGSVSYFRLIGCEIASSTASAKEEWCLTFFLNPRSEATYASSHTQQALSSKMECIERPI